MLSSLPQPAIAVPVYLFVEHFTAWEPVGLGFAAGAMFWVAAFELVADAIQEISVSKCTLLIGASFSVMMGVSSWLHHLTSLEETGQSAHGDLQIAVADLVQMGFGSHPYVLPLVYSLLAGLSTGLGGLLILPMQRMTCDEATVTAFLLATAASAMLTVSGFDLFYKIVREIGLSHTLITSLSGATIVIVAKKIGSYFLATDEQHGKSSEKKESERRLLRIGLLTSVTLTLHNLPEGMAVAISTVGSVRLGFKLAIAIALHNIPEGLAITCPLIMSKKYSPSSAIGVAFASGLRYASLAMCDGEHCASTKMPPQKVSLLHGNLASSSHLAIVTSSHSLPSCIQ